MWEGASTRLEGALVVLEPLRREHAAGLFAASRDPAVWRWLSFLQPATRDEFDAWLEDALARAAAGLDVPFATLEAGTGTPIGSTR